MCGTSEKESPAASDEVTTSTTAICNDACYLIVFIVGMVNCQLRNDFKGRGRKCARSKAEGGGGGGWPLILRIFGMVSVTFFFLPPPPPLGLNPVHCRFTLLFNLK